jgi:hypothetical protein
MKHAAQEQIRTELDGASREEEITYWRNVESEMTRRRERLTRHPSDEE